MGGFFGVASDSTVKCITHLFYGTDYHSHLGIHRGGLAAVDNSQFTRVIHDISNSQFRSKFDADLEKLKGTMSIGVISDYEDQPLIIGSHLGTYAIVTVGAITNAESIAKRAFRTRKTHFSEVSGGGLNPTELTAALINEEESFEAGIKNAQELIEGSMSILILTHKGIYAVRDKFGRTPVIIGKGQHGYAVTMETCAFYNLEYEVEKELGPGEAVFITRDGMEQRVPPGERMKMCSFLWIYYGFPASDYEGINVEHSRYRSGAILADNDNIEVDFAAGIPDSGVAHALGYAQKKHIRYSRPFVKYSPTWARSFLPRNQTQRELVAKMKLIPIKQLIHNKKILFCDDSIVRGTQLRDTLQRIYTYGAKEIHMRLACPPLFYSCPYLNFSRSRTESNLATRKTIAILERGESKYDINEYINEQSDKHAALIKYMRSNVGLTTLAFQKLDDMVTAIGVPKEKLCTYCWTGCGDETTPNSQCSLF